LDGSARGLDAQATQARGLDGRGVAANVPKLPSIRIRFVVGEATARLVDRL
jgi:hypothetical protein